jgi:hypothetical protein
LISRPRLSRNTDLLKWPERLMKNPFFKMDIKIRLISRILPDSPTTANWPNSQWLRIEMERTIRSKIARFLCLRQQSCSSGDPRPEARPGSTRALRRLPSLKSRPRSLPLRRQGGNDPCRKNQIPRGSAPRAAQGKLRLLAGYPQASAPVNTPACAARVIPLPAIRPVRLATPGEFLSSIGCISSQPQRRQGAESRRLGCVLSVARRVFAVLSSQPKAVSHRFHAGAFDHLPPA